MLVVGLFAWASLQGCGTQSEGRSSMLYFRFRETQGMLCPNHRKVINGRNTTEAESLSPSDQLQFCTPGLGVPSRETHVHPDRDGPDWLPAVSPANCAFAEPRLGLKRPHHSRQVTLVFALHG